MMYGEEDCQGCPTAMSFHLLGDEVEVTENYGLCPTYMELHRELLISAHNPHPQFHQTRHLGNPETRRSRGQLD
jgi:hypothetical protein